MPIIPTLGRLRQKALELEASLDYILRPYLKKQKEAKYSGSNCNHNYTGG
jgi:hypothetical protein